jgi:hypothetical protein
MWLPDQLGYLGGTLLTFGALLLAFLVVDWWEFQTSIMLPPSAMRDMQRRALASIYAPLAIRSS